MSTSILFFGGTSDERLVSTASAQNLARQVSFTELWFMHPTGAISKTTATELAAHQRPFEVLFVPQEAPFAESFDKTLSQLKGKTVFLGFHGDEGENGTIQKALEIAGIAFTGSGSKASELCFNKLSTKESLARHGLPVAEQVSFTSKDQSEIKNILDGFFQKYGAMVVKPVESGSSFGLHILHTADTLSEVAKAIAGAPYKTFMIEKFLQGRELTVGVIDTAKGLQVLPPSEVVLLKGHSFDYQGKYLGKGSKEITPADLNESEKSAAQELALKAHKVLGCYGYSRTDMILTSNGPVFLETNTLPGLSTASFIPQQLQAAGISVAQFIESQLALAQKRPRL